MWQSLVLVWLLNLYIISSLAYNHGDVFAGVGHGVIRRYSRNGDLLATLTGGAGAYVTGMTFDAAGNLYATRLNASVVEKFNVGGVFIGTFAVCDLDSNCDSIVPNANGDFYVGQQAGTARVLKFRGTDGVRLADFAPTRGVAGVNLVALAPDDCTLFYTSNDALIRRYNICQAVQLSPFASAPAATPIVFGVAIRSNAEVLVASYNHVYRYSAAGLMVQTYTSTLCSNPNDCIYYSMALDPDGATFWTGDIRGGKIFHFNIATGAVIRTIATQPETVLGGIAVYGGPSSTPTVQIVATPSTQIATLQAQINLTITGLATYTGLTLHLQVISGPNVGLELATAPNAEGQATFYIMATQTGTDNMAITLREAGVVRAITQAIVTWQSVTSDVCTIGSTRCQGLMLQTCRYSVTGAAIWDTAQSCCPHYVCGLHLGIAECVDSRSGSPSSSPSTSSSTSTSSSPSTSSSTSASSSSSASTVPSLAPSVSVPCQAGDMQCLDTQTYRICQGVPASWSTQTQTCGANLVCRQAANLIYCIDAATASSGTESCQAETMRCDVADATRFQRCMWQFGVYSWSSSLACPSQTICREFGTTAYCVDVQQPPIEACTANTMRCATINTYQSCLNQLGVWSWGMAQACGAGLTCQPAGDVVYCV